MNKFRAALRRIRGLIGKTGADQDLNDELEAHLSMHIDDNLRAGMTPGEARRQTLVALGGVEQIRERCRDRNGVPALEILARDLRYAGRQLVRNPTFSLAVGLTLALCIGANAALFSVVHSVLLRPLPIPESERILVMSNAYPGASDQAAWTSGVTDFYDRLRETTVFEEQALFIWDTAIIDQNGTPARVGAMSVTPSFFRLLRVSPQIGRIFSPEEGEVGNEQKIVISDALWRSHFGGDPGVVGRDLRLDGQPFTIVGVMPRSFDFVDNGVLLWRPVAFSAAQKSDENRHSNGWWNIGRLKPGATVALAQAQIDALNAANVERFPQFKQILANARFHTIVERLQDRLVGNVKALLYLLWGGALFVLMIGCLNVSNLVIIRSRIRLQELATRLALGAGRWRIACQLVLETLVLTMMSAAAGLACASALLRVFTALDIQTLPRRWEIQLTPTAIACTIAGAALTGVVLGLIPVLTALPADLNAALRNGGRGGTSDAHVFRRTLAVAQIGFAFVLLLGAGLLFASFRRVLAVDPGFTADGVLTASVGLPTTRYPDDAALRAFADRALAEIRALPGVVAAGGTDTIPLGANRADSVIIPEGHQMQPGESLVSPNRIIVTPGYFTAMGARLTSGRFFDERDGTKASQVVIIDEALARRFWPGDDAVGHRVYGPTTIKDVSAVTAQTVFLTVVGVVAEIRLVDLAAPASETGASYVPYVAQPSRGLTFAVKTTGDSASLSSGVRGAVARLDRELPVVNVRTMNDRVSRSLTNRRVAMLLALGFGTIALLLSALGIYGVLAYLVVQRTKEIGIRMALGSSVSAIFTLVVREGALLTGIGLVLGAVSAAVLQQSLQSQLFGIRATDPAVLGAVMVLLTMVALVACAVPARRASRVDPLVALRDD